MKHAIDVCEKVWMKYANALSSMVIGLCRDTYGAIQLYKFKEYIKNLSNER